MDKQKLAPFKAPSVGVSAIGARAPAPSAPLLIHLTGYSSFFRPLPLSLSLSVFLSDRFVPKRTEGLCRSHHICSPETSMLVFWTEIRPSFLEIEVSSIVYFRALL